MKKIFFAAIVLFALTVITANAQTTARSNTGRQASQQARNHQGRHSGELNRAETARLEREQRRIQIEKRIAKADGTVTPAEKKFLRREQNRASRHIYREKNDAQQR